MSQQIKDEDSGIKSLNKPRKTSAFLQLMSLHWAMYYCYVILFVSGAFMARLPRATSYRGDMYDFHKGIGAVVIALLTLRILILLRVWWKKYTKRTPKFTKEWLKKVALHTSLYIFMWVVPVSGFFFSNSFKSNNVKVFGVVLPDLFPQNSGLVDLGRSLHFWFSYTFLAFMILHIIDQKKVVKAFWHRLQNKRRFN